MDVGVCDVVTHPTSANDTSVSGVATYTVHGAGQESRGSFQACVNGFDDGFAADSNVQAAHHYRAYEESVMRDGDLDQNNPSRHDGLGLVSQVLMIVIYFFSFFISSLLFFVYLFCSSSSVDSTQPHTLAFSFIFPTYTMHSR